MVGSVAQSAVTAEQRSTQGPRPRSWLTWALWHLKWLPVSFQELEDSKWEALTAGLGGGRKGKTFFTRLSVSSRRHLTSRMHLWPCSGMHLRSEDLLWQNSSLLFWKGGWFDSFLTLLFRNIQFNSVISLNMRGGRKMRWWHAQFFFSARKKWKDNTCWENNKCIHKEIHAMHYFWPAVTDFATPKCLEFLAHQWWRPATEIPAEEHENSLPFLHIKFRPWGKKDEEKQLHIAVNKGSISIKTLSAGERKNPVHWLKKQRETYGLTYLTCSG